MLLLFAAFVLLAFAYRRLVRPATPSKKPTTSPPEKTSAHKKLLQEAFEHSSKPDEKPPPDHRVLILYATEYGFAAEVAQSIARDLSSPSPDDSADESAPVGVALTPRVINALHFRVVDFTREPFVLLVCSTTGDGVPPNEAAAFRDALASRDVVFPPTTRFAVLALGDRSYPHFCRAGALLDALLPSASRLLARTDVDQEDWPVIQDWTMRARKAIVENRPSDRPPTPDYLHAAIDKYAAGLSACDPVYTLGNPYMALLKTRRRLSAPVATDGHKEVVRFEFDLGASGLRYEVGDALAVIPKNDSRDVEHLLQILARNGDELVQLAADGPTASLESLLTDRLDILTGRPQLVVFLQRHCGNASEVALAKRILGFDARDPTHRGRASVSEFGKSYLADRLVVDVLMDFASASVSPSQLVRLLGPLHARYYSISSSPVTSPNAIAITVDVLRYTIRNSSRQGLASTFLQDRCRVGHSRIPVFLSRNPNFRLPVDAGRPLIMVGPGTGLAPFIGFLEERVARNSPGENWLFFGCRFSEQDFIYEQELQNFVSDGVLNLRTAFSRDGPHKVYVQDRMREVADTLWRLIDEQDAHVYICGDGGQMAPDVDRALTEIIQSEGGLSDDDAVAYLSRLSDARRYQRDVWLT